MKTKYIIIIAVVVLGIITLSSSTYIVQEKEQVIITQFGKPIGEAITEPGLHFKVPFTQNANTFEKRYMEWDGDPEQVPTKGKKYIFVDTYARWQITNPLQFYKRLKNERGAQSRLDDILDGATRNYIAKNYVDEVVRSSNRITTVIDTLQMNMNDTLANIKIGRAKIQQEIINAANEQTRELGIKVLDFRFKRINYEKKVQTQVYERMKSERFKIADKFRSEGQGDASKINGEKEKELLKIQSEAFKKAEEIKGKADAEAAAIYTAAYNKNNSSKGLYSFLKSMETLDKTSRDETSIILSTDSELYKYLKSAK